jgi:hypothetical protein
MPSSLPKHWDGGHVLLLGGKTRAIPAGSAQSDNFCEVALVHGMTRGVKSRHPGLLSG